MMPVFKMHDRKKLNQAKKTHTENNCMYFKMIHKQGERNYQRKDAF